MTQINFVAACAVGGFTRIKNSKNLHVSIYVICDAEKKKIEHGLSGLSLIGSAVISVACTPQSEYKSASSVF